MTRVNGAWLPPVLVSTPTASGAVSVNGAGNLVAWVDKWGNQGTGLFTASRISDTEWSAASGITGSSNTAPTYVQYSADGSTIAWAGLSPGSSPMVWRTGTTTMLRRNTIIKTRTKKHSGKFVVDVDPNVSPHRKVVVAKRSHGKWVPWRSVRTKGKNELASLVGRGRFRITVPPKGGFAKAVAYVTVR